MSTPAAPARDAGPPAGLAGARRWVVVGNTGSGKTTLARRLAEATGGVHVELDALGLLPGWRPRPSGDLLRLVDRATAGPRWVVDGNWPAVRDLVWGRAEVVVWVDPPLPVTFARLLVRSLRRGATGEQLWGTNVERLRNLVDPRPDRNVLLWCLTRHRHYRRTYRAAMGDPRWAALRWVWLRSPGAAGTFADAVEAGTDPGCRPSRGGLL